MNDPDIRGWRSRFPQPDGSTFSVTVTTSPNSYTKAGAMLVKDRSMTALHHARMSFRRRPIPGKAKMFDPDVFNVTSRNGVRGSAEFKIGNIAAIGIDDAIALCGETWKKSGQSLWDGRHRELWLVTPRAWRVSWSVLWKRREAARNLHMNINDRKNVNGTMPRQRWTMPRISGYGRQISHIRFMKKSAGMFTTHPHAVRISNWFFPTGSAVRKKNTIRRPRCKNSGNETVLRRKRIFQHGILYP